MGGQYGCVIESLWLVDGAVVKPEFDREDRAGVCGIAGYSLCLWIAVVVIKFCAVEHCTCVIPSPAKLRTRKCQMLFKLSQPIKPLIKLLETLRKVIEKKLTSQTINLLAILLVVTTTILSAQLFIALLLMKVLEI